MPIILQRGDHVFDVACRVEFDRNFKWAKVWFWDRGPANSDGKNPSDPTSPPPPRLACQMILSRAQIEWLWLKVAHTPRLLLGLHAPRFAVGPTVTLTPQPPQVGAALTRPSPFGPQDATTPREPQPPAGPRT